MHMAIVTVLIMALIIFGAMTLVQAHLNGTDAIAQSLVQSARTDDEIARTKLDVVDASAEPWADMLRLRLLNSGQTKLSQFDKWDMIMGYDDADGIHHETYLPFTNLVMDLNQWQKVGIYLDRYKETFDPGILNPGEEIVIGARPSPMGMPNSMVNVTISTPNGVQVSTSLMNSSGYAVLTPHSENWTLRSGSYYWLKDWNLANGTGTIMTTDAIAKGQTGRWLLHNAADASRVSRYVFSLAGIQTIPAATWKVYYRGSTSGSWNPGTARLSTDVIIRKCDGTVRQTISTNVAEAPITDFSQWQTISADYYFPGYAVIDDTDYLEVDFYAASGGPVTSGYINLDVDNRLYSYTEGTVVNTTGPTLAGWIQTTQADFEAGVLNQVNTTISPGNVELAAVTWPYRKSITIDHTKVSADLTDFPVLVSLASDTDLASDALDNGNDILFTSSDGTTKLAHEIEQFDGSTGKLVAWVKVPSLSSSSDTIIYLNYGNPSSPNQQNPTGVWDSNYKAVWHFGETVGGSGAIKDSTTNGNNGTDKNSPTLGSTGKVGKAVSFDGTNDYINVSDSASLDMSGNFTVQLWFSPTQAYTATADYLQGLLDKGGYKLLLDKSDGKLKAEVTNGSTAWTRNYDGGQERIRSLAVYNGKLYAGQGDGTGDGDVLVFDGTTWSVSYNGAQEIIYALAVYNGKLYAGQGTGTGDGDVLVFDGNTWTTSYNGSKAVIMALAVYNGKLYAGQGDGSGDVDVLVFDGSSWTTSYNGSQEIIYALAVYNGKLYAGQGSDTGDGDVYVLNAGSDVQSTTTSWSTSFHLVTATKSGTTLTLYVDSAQQASVAVSANVETNALNLLIGKVYGTRGTGVGEGLFAGIMDELRISNTTRSPQWIATEYNNQNSPSTFCRLGAEERPNVSSGTIASQVYDCMSSGAVWTSFSWTKTLPASTNITFEVRASDSLFLKDAATPSWTSVGGTSPVVSGLPAGRYKQWRATLTTTVSTGTPILSDVTVSYTR